MKTNTDHIATSHVGSLPRPDSLIAAFHAMESGQPLDEHTLDTTLRNAVQATEQEIRNMLQMAFPED